MDRPGPVRRLRERLVLGPVRAAVDDEPVLRWGHVQAPDDGRHGILAFTERHCVVHWIARDQPDEVIAWDDVIGWDTHRTERGGPVLTLHTATAGLTVRLPSSTKARASKATALLRVVGDLAPADTRRTAGFSGSGTFWLQAERRGVRGYTRRIAVTIAGVLLILLGFLFASPFLPGPGVLTILAGLAVLATEYDWAREISIWFRRKMERFWQWRRERRARRRAERRRESQDVREPRQGMPSVRLGLRARLGSRRGRRGW